MGKHQTKGVLGNHLKDRSFRLVHWLNITLSLRKTSQESINLKRKFYLDCSLDTLYTWGWIWKGDILVADIEELETMDASEIYSKRLNAKEVIFPGENGKNSSRRWTNQNFWRRSGTENIHLGTASTNSRRKSHWLSWRIRRVSSTTSRLVSGCRWSDKCFLVHVRKLHIPPARWTQSQTLLAERRIIPYSNENIDVSRTTRTNLDVKQENRIDDYWNIDGSRDLSDPWTGFTQFTLLEEKAPDGYMWSRVRLTRREATSTPDHLWPELSTKMGRNAKLKEKHKWSDEKRNSIMREDYEESISLTLRTRSS